VIIGVRLGEVQVREEGTGVEGEAGIIVGVWGLASLTGGDIVLRRDGVTARAIRTSQVMLEDRVEAILVTWAGRILVGQGKGPTVQATRL